MNPTRLAKVLLLFDVQTQTKNKRRLLPGSALACALALNRSPDGELVDVRQWCRADDITFSSS